MKKFKVTGNKFNGEAIVAFDNDNRLVLVDVSNTDMTEGNVSWCLNNFPRNFESFKMFILNLNKNKVLLHVVEEDVTITFDEFWEAYKKKINRKRCVPLWNKLSEQKKFAAFRGIQKYEQYLKKESWRGKLDPENYLRDEIWESEF